jgi:hypothetical protein
LNRAAAMAMVPRSLRNRCRSISVRVICGNDEIEMAVAKNRANTRGWASSSQPRL